MNADEYGKTVQNDVTTKSTKVTKKGTVLRGGS